MSSKFIIDSMLPKYQQPLHGNLFGGALELSGSPPRAGAGSPAQPARMYPYVAHHNQFGGAPVVGGFPPSALAVAAADADKSCRYPPSAADTMVNYLGHHQNGGTSTAASVSAASASMAAAAQFYQQAAAASAASAASADSLGSCSQPAPAPQPLPDLPRYPWMSITGLYQFFPHYL